jgi:multiple sugar transport system substrate-binding protein
VVYYNKTLFQQAGLPEPSPAWTWEDFLQTAQALTRDTDNDGRTDQFGLGTEVSLFRVAPFIWQNGGELANAPVSPTQLMLDTPEATEAIQWFVDLQVKYHVTPNAEEEAAEDSESRFMNGTVGMYFNSRRTTPTFREITAFEWDVAPLPQHKHIASILHADGYCMPSTVKDKALVWKFIEFANSPTGQAIVAETGRTVPSLKAVAESPAFLDPDASPRNSRVFLDAIPYLRAVPISAAWVDIEEAVGEELKRAFYGQASVAEVIQAALERSQIYLVEEP